MPNMYEPINAGLNASVNATPTSPLSVEAFSAKIAACTEAAVQPTCNTDFRNLFEMVVSVAREGWQEAKMEFKNAELFKD